MRKDVILGMSIGGVLLAVFIVYLTVMPHGPKKGATLETGGQALSEGSGAGGSDAPEPVADNLLHPTDEASHVIPLDAAHPQPAAPAPDDARTAVTPSDQAVVAPTHVDAASEGPTVPDRWMTVLNSGKTMVSDTPMEAPKPDAAATPGVVTFSAAAPQPTAGATDGGAIKPANYLDGSAIKPAHYLHDQGQSGAGDADGGAGPLAGGDMASTTALDHSRGAVDTSAVIPAAAAFPATRPTAGTRIHKIQANENFSTIAAAAYGSASYYPYILRANPSVNPNRLKIGQEIVLPPASEVHTPAPAARAVTPLAPAAPSGSSAALDPTTQYTVVAGDSLHKIARKLYGNTALVEKIYELNSDMIGPDRARLKVNMVLKLPAPPTVTVAH